MEIEQVEDLIQEAEQAMKQAEAAKNKINKQKGLAKAKQEKLEPIEAAITHLRTRITMLLQIKDAKIPFYDKLPKDHQFYKHFMMSIEYNRMSKAATQYIDDGKKLFQGAMMRIRDDEQVAKGYQSPGNSPKKRKVYQ